MSNKALAGIAVVVGIVFVIAGVLYATKDAGSLPSFFPAYLANSHAHHMKHAIVCFVVGAFCFVFAWFQSGSKPSAAAKG